MQLEGLGHTNRHSATKKSLKLVLIFNRVFDALHKIKQIKLEITGCFNCKQVQLLRRTQGKQNVAKNSRYLENNGSYAQPCNGFLKLNQFPLKNSAFDFGTTIGCIDSTFILYCCSHKYQFGEAN